MRLMGGIGAAPVAMRQIFDNDQTRRSNLHIQIDEFARSARRLSSEQRWPVDPSRTKVWIFKRQLRNKENLRRVGVLRKSSFLSFQVEVHVQRVAVVFEGWQVPAAQAVRLEPQQLRCRPKDVVSLPLEMHLFSEKW